MELYALFELASKTPTVYDEYMIKFLPIGVLIFLVVAVGGFLWIKRSETKPTQQIKQLKDISGQTNINTFAPVSNDDRIKILEDAVIVLAKKVNGESGSTSATTGLDSRVSSLEDKVTALQRQISQPQPKMTPIPTSAVNSSVKQPPSYIPLGWVASSSALDWTTVTTQSIIIDTNDYPGYTSAVFEAFLMPYQGNGKAYARLYNGTDTQSIGGSEVSVSAIDYTWVSSSNFSLPSGKKTYNIQLKTTTGYASTVQNARIKIIF